MKKDPNSREVKESIIVNDIIDYFCIFNKLEQYLYNPIRLKEQILYQISDDNFNKLIEKYAIITSMFTIGSSVYWDYIKDTIRMIRV